MEIIFRTKRQLISVTALRLQESDNKQCYVQGLINGTNSWINIICYTDEREGQKLLDKVFVELMETKKNRIFTTI